MCMTCDCGIDEIIIDGTAPHDDQHTHDHRARDINPSAHVLRVSAETGDGMPGRYDHRARVVAVA
jgi:hypothetical protein